MKVMLFQSLYSINFHFRYKLYVHFLSNLHTQVIVRNVQYCYNLVQNVHRLLLLKIANDY